MISVIVPFKNSAEWIGRCLDSLKRQEGDFEFLIVNDHSTDNGREIVESYLKDKRFLLLDNERGAGVSGARNTGLDHSRGEWFTFLDADDEMMPNAWRLFTDALRTEADIHQFNHLRLVNGVTRMKRANEGGFYDLSQLPECWWGVWNKLFKKGIFEGVRFVEGMQYGEDGMFVLECLEISEVIHHAERTATTTLHRFDNKQSLSHIKTADDILEMSRNYEKFYERQTDLRMKRNVCIELSKIWERARDILENMMSSTS